MNDTQEQESTKTNQAPVSEGRLQIETDICNELKLASELLGEEVAPKKDLAAFIGHRTEAVDLVCIRLRERYLPYAAVPLSHESEPRTIAVEKLLSILNDARSCASNLRNTTDGGFVEIANQYNSKIASVEFLPHLVAIRDERLRRIAAKEGHPFTLATILGLLVGITFLFAVEPRVQLEPLSTSHVRLWLALVHVRLFLGFLFLDLDYSLKRARIRFVGPWKRLGEFLLRIALMLTNSALPRFLALTDGLWLRVVLGTQIILLIAHNLLMRKILYRKGKGDRDYKSNFLILVGDAFFVAATIALLISSPSRVTPGKVWPWLAAFSGLTLAFELLLVYRESLEILVREVKVYLGELPALSTDLSTAVDGVSSEPVVREKVERTSSASQPIARTDIRWSLKDGLTRLWESIMRRRQNRQGPMARYLLIAQSEGPASAEDVSTLPKARMEESRMNSYVITGDPSTCQLHQYHLVVAPSFECNLKCAHCYLPSHSSDALDSGVVGRMLDDWSQLVQSERGMLGGTVHFKGGEPTLLPYLSDAIKRVASAGILRFMMTTNGQEIGGDVLDALVAMMKRSPGSTIITVSIEGGALATHERLRGEGSFGRAWQSIAELVTRGVPVHINTVLMRSTTATIGDLVRRAAGSGVTQVNLLPFVRRGVGANLDSEWLGPMARYEAAKKIYDGLTVGERDLLRGSLPGLLAQGGLILRECVAGYKGYYYVVPSGDVYSCPNLAHSKFQLGNVLTDSITAIHQRASDEAVRKQVGSYGVPGLDVSCRGVVFLEGEAERRREAKESKKLAELLHRGRAESGAEIAACFSRNI